MDFETVEKVAVRVLKENKHHYLQFIALMQPDAKKKRKCYIIGAPTADDGQHEIALQGMRKFVQEMKPERYFCITEAWYVQAETEHDFDVRPMHNPKRKEALIISEFCATMKTKHVAITFEHKDGEIVITGRHEPSESHSRMNFFLEDSTAERIEMERKKLRDTQKKQDKGDKEHGKKS